MAIGKHIVEHEILGVDDTTTLDNRYVNTSGDVMTGELDMQDNAIILEASDATRWRVTVDTSGALVTTQIVTAGLTGQPIGLLLALTHSS